MQTQVLGRDGAEVALRILKGETAGQIDSPHVLFGAPIYDWRELKRWNISEALLPSNSVVLFREPPVWEQYRGQVMAALAIGVFQTVLIAGLLIERARRQRATEQAARARAESGQHRESLAHLVRVHTVGEMSAAIVHEVTQPLAAIKNYAFAAQYQLARDTTKVDALLDKIEEQASRAGDVLHSLRAMVKKKQQSEPDRIEIGRLVADSLKLVEMENHLGDIRVESTIAPDLPPVFADGIQIQQVVLNLTRNAVEAMEEAGQAGEITIGVQGNGNGEIVVSVADQGPGIAPADAERVFGPFYSTKGAGLGVGLSISRAIVEAHGGRLSLSPNARGGCVFRFTLPVAKEGH
jgi:C4-dicarboxylate-specific signal transduction histidine kinase